MRMGMLIYPSARESRKQNRAQTDEICSRNGQISNFSLKNEKRKNLKKVLDKLR